ncbi:hypothetical protein DPV93_02885 [Haemophilus sputorum]|uniref:Uncharacterized protein n=1 Tax=Haemophilus sputorum TaxID=1078480 RepID=A0A369YJ49_9PAST|nr:hypothetical protein [Haemophilus sputorum]RDE73047.1 hypothetical protein DPV93_02885 [Haemophilus sputorum]
MSEEEKKSKLKMDKITLSPKTERAIVLSQLTDKSSMLIDLNDIAILLNCSYNTVQSSISKKPDFPKPVENVLDKGLHFRSADVIKWIKRYTPRFR